MSQLNIIQCNDDTDYITWMPTDGVCICLYIVILLMLHIRRHVVDVYNMHGTCFCYSTA